MITKTDKYWHFYFCERCEDTPAALLELVEKCLKEAAQMGDIQFLRVPLTIEHEKLFEGGTQGIVYYRFSSEAPPENREEPVLFGFGVQKA
jgi:hypothetical protein